MSSSSDSSSRTSGSSDSRSTDGDELIDFTGDVLKNRYIVLKEIGHGAFSTVWLVYDFNTKNFKAIKIQHVHDYDAGKAEIEVMQKIDTQNCPYLNRLEDHFEYESDHGVHVCMVSELFACCLYDLIKSGKYKDGLPLPFVKKVTKQILTGLDVLHKRTSAIHTDVKPENVLLVGVNKKLEPFINKIKELNVENIYKQVSEGFKNNKSKKDAKNDILKKTASKLIEKLDDFFGDDSDSDTDQDDKKADKKGDKTDDKKDEKKDDRETGFALVDEIYIQNPQIKITDFGNCCYLNDKTRSEIQTRYYRAPEIILQHPYDEKSDIWSMGCMVFELLTGDILFDPDKDRKISRDKHHLYWFQQLLGKFPDEFLKNCKKKRLFFTKNNCFKGIKKMSYLPFQTLLVDTYKVSQDNANTLTDFLIPMLQYFPNKRVSAKNSLQHSWLAI
jgi:serine/threonine-protein kinase SRPK3